VVDRADFLFCADETDLDYCGEDSEEENLTYDTTTVIYDSECNICPDNGDCATIKYLSPDTEITVTCWTDAGGAVIGDTYVQNASGYPSFSTSAARNG
jgi:hypothetical protein